MWFILRWPDAADRTHGCSRVTLAGWPEAAWWAPFRKQPFSYRTALLMTPSTQILQWKQSTATMSSWWKQKNDSLAADCVQKDKTLRVCVCVCMCVCVCVCVCVCKYNFKQNLVYSVWLFVAAENIILFSLNVCSSFSAVCFLLFFFFTG